MKREELESLEIETDLEMSKVVEFFTKSKLHKTLRKHQNTLK